MFTPTDGRTLTPHEAREELQIVSVRRWLLDQEFASSPAFQQSVSTIQRARRKLLADRHEAEKRRIAGTGTARVLFQTNAPVTMAGPMSDAQRDAMMQSIAQATQALQVAAAQPRPGPNNPPGVRALGKIDPPPVFDRNRTDIESWLMKWPIHWELLGSLITDHQMILSVAQKLDEVQSLWFEALMKEKKRAGEWDAFTYAQFTIVLIEHTNVLSTKEAERALLMVMKLGKLENPGQFHTQFNISVRRIGENDEAAYYRYKEKIHPEYDAEVNRARIDETCGTALVQAQKIVERFYTTTTGNPVLYDGDGSHGNSSYASSVVRRKSDQTLLGAVVGQGTGEQRVGAPSYTGCNTCGGMDHYAANCPMNRISKGNGNAMWAQGPKGSQYWKGKGKGGGKGRGKGQA